MNTVSKLRMSAIAGLAALSLAGVTGQGLAQTAGGNGGGASAPGAGPSPSGGTGGRVWSFRGPAHGPVLCASAACMRSAGASAPPLTHVPGRGQNRRPVALREVPAESCSTIRYVYPNGTVIVQKDCPRAVIGR